MMEDFKNNDAQEKRENDIVFSKALKAGKRIYYLDVKKNRMNELFLAITESKRIVSGTIEMPYVQFEKHKIFLYKEDFEKFLNGLHETIDYIKMHNMAEKRIINYSSNTVSKDDDDNEINYNIE